MTDKSAFVLLHGAWHSAACWSVLEPLLLARGHVVRTPDLPGAGKDARIPSAIRGRPFDPLSFASEPSPAAAVTQDERTRAIVALVEQTVQETGAPVVLVGHSLGGVTTTAVAEAVPDLLAAIVYLTGVLLPPGMSTFDFLGRDVMTDSRATSLMLADPQLVGACRINPRSTEAAYRTLLKSIFAADTSDVEFGTALAGLHYDEPAQVFATPTAASAARFGRVPRHYIRCIEDQCLLVPAQDFMIAAADQAYGASTRVHDLPGSHSPFLSRPDALRDVLGDIAGQSHHDRQRPQRASLKLLSA